MNLRFRLAAFLWILIFVAELNVHASVEKEQALKLGVICALPKELGTLADEMADPISSEIVGMRQYLSGRLWGTETILVTSRVGKVAAATTATHLIESGKVHAIVFIGVAGAIDSELAQGDIVIGERLIHYDFDSRPLVPQFTVPLLNIAEFEANPFLLNLATRAATDYLNANSSFKQPSNRVHLGLIGTGDRFVSDESHKATLRSALPSLLAVDMEGAAVAQVCHEHHVPFVVIRAISDGCDQDAAISCMQFLREVAPVYTREVLQRLYAQLPLSPANLVAHSAVEQDH